jgi:hypothetical protein
MLMIVIYQRLPNRYQQNHIVVDNQISKKVKRPLIEREVLPA